jgi:hypothetical protein
LRLAQTPKTIAAKRQLLRPRSQRQNHAAHGFAGAPGAPKRIDREFRITGADTGSLAGKIRGELPDQVPVTARGLPSDRAAAECIRPVKFVPRENFAYKQPPQKKTPFFNFFLRFFALRIKQNGSTTPYI